MDWDHARLHKSGHRYCRWILLALGVLLTGALAAAPAAAAPGKSPQLLAQAAEPERDGSETDEWSEDPDAKGEQGGEGDEGAKGDAPGLTPAAPEAEGSAWFYREGADRNGPVSAEEIRSLYKARKLTGGAWVWKKGMTAWAFMIDVAEFADIVDWLVVKNGKKIGPFKTAQIYSMVEAGMLSPADRAWRRGADDWSPLASYRELARMPKPPVVSNTRNLPGQPGSEDEDLEESAIPDYGDASSGRAQLSRSDLAGSGYVDSHFYALEAGADATAGRLVMGVRIPIRKRVMLGLEMVLPWVKPDDGDGTVLFGNMALSADFRIFGDELIFGLIGFKMYMPILGDVGGSSEVGTLIGSYMVNPYEPGFYLPYTMTLRPDFKLYTRFARNMVIAAEMGFDFLFAINDDKVASTSSSSMFRKENFILNWHMGAKFGYLIKDLVFPNLEFTMSQFAYISDGDAGDVPFLFTVGPGVHLQYEHFEAGLTFQVPTDEDISETIKVSPCLKVGGRW